MIYETEENNYCGPKCQKKHKPYKGLEKIEQNKY